MEKNRTTEPSSKKRKEEPKKKRKRKAKSSLEFYEWGRPKNTKTLTPFDVDLMALEMVKLEKEEKKARLRECFPSLEYPLMLTFNDVQRRSLLPEIIVDDKIDIKKEGLLKEKMDASETNLPDWCFLTVIDSDEDSDSDDENVSDTSKKQRYFRVSLDGKTINTRELIVSVMRLYAPETSILFLPGAVITKATYERAAALLALCPKLKDWNGEIAK